MGSRPLRQYYASDSVPVVPVTLDPGLPLLEPWRAHRARFLDELHALDADAWGEPTRCDAWTVREVVGHLIVVDGFWSMTVTNARDRAEPSRFLVGFDPSSSTDALVEATTTVTIGELLEQYVGATDNLVKLADGFTDADWDARSESPLGHLPARWLLAHAYWDSWLHERDIFTVRGEQPGLDADEVLAVTAFNLGFAGLQGGLVNDPAAVAAGPDAPIDVCLAFADIPDRPVHVSIGTLSEGVHVSACSAGHTAVDAGRALDVVDGLTGRAILAPALAALPADLASQVERASLVL